MPTEKLICVKLAYDKCLILTVEEAGPLLALLSRHPLYTWTGYGTGAIYRDSIDSLEIHMIQPDQVEHSLSRMMQTAIPAPIPAAAAPGDDDA